jgi:hypothetical protein
VSKNASRTILIIFSVFWIGWTLMLTMGGILGDCFDDTYSKCWAGKEYGPSITLWRGLAVELLAVVIYLLYSRRRTS